MRDRRRARESGEVPLFAIIAILALVGVVYVVSTFGGAYVDNLRLRQAMIEVLNAYAREKNPDLIRARLLSRLETLVVESVPGDDGEPIEVRPLVPSDPEEIEVTIFESSGKMRIRYPYTRSVRLPGLGRTRTLHFAPEVEGDTIGTVERP